MRKIYISAILFIAMIFASNSAKAINYFYMGGGASITLLTSWSTSSTSAGVGVPTSFGGPAPNTWTFFGPLNLTLSTTWTVATNATINFGDGTNAFNFIQQAYIGVGSPNQPNMNIKNNCTFTTQFNQGYNGNKTNPSTGSTFVYEGAATDLVATFSPYSNLIINTDVSLSSISPVTVSETLTINNGRTISLNSAPITFNAIAGTGEFIGASGGNANMTITGSGNAGTLRFQTGFQYVNSLTISGSSTISLGTDLLIDGSNGGILTLGAGALNLNGHMLTLDNFAGADFGTGEIMGSGSSILLLKSVSSMNGSLNMASGANTLKALYLDAAGQTLTLGNALNITDSITAFNGEIASGGNLTLKSTEMLKGRVGQMGPTGSITGAVTVETFAKGPTTGWAELGVGVEGQTIGSWDGQFPITCYGCTYSPDDADGFYSVQGWDPEDPTFTYYNTNVTSATPLTPGTGFWVYLGASSSGAGDITYSNTGTLVQGPVSHPIVNPDITGDLNTEGFNLLANPYACPISLDKLYDFNSQGPANWKEGGIHIWNTEDNGGMGGDNFITPGSGAIIAAGQGFYVQAFNTGFQAFDFDESMKTEDNTNANPLIRSVQETAATTGFKLKVTGPNGDADKTSFRFNSAATIGFDNRYDGHKLFTSPGYMGTGAVYNQYTSISSYYQGHYYTLNTLPVLTHEQTLPVAVRVATTGVYSISLEDVQNYPGCTMLKDKLTGTYHDLRTSPYICSINDTTSAPRFELLMCEMNTVTTSLKNLNASSGRIQVIQDEEGPFVTTFFPQNTKATISVYNVVGQQLIKDLEVEGTETKTRLNVNSHNEVLLIRVSTPNETVTKKIITR